MYCNREYWFLLERSTKKKLNADEKLDKICILLGTVISTSLSPPSKSNQLKTLQKTNVKKFKLKQNFLFHLK